MRPIALCLLAAALIAGRTSPTLAAPAPVDPAPGSAVWRSSCSGQGGDRFCTVTATPRYADNRGDAERVTLTLRRDARCTSLHVAFERTIDVNRPVLLQVDEEPVQAFHTPRELNNLADAVDAGGMVQTIGGEPGFAAFLTEIATGRVAAGDAAAAELVARFARIKESRRLGVACEATDRLLPMLRNGHQLHLSFHVVTGQPREPYHWPALNRREVVVPLDTLALALDSLPALQ